MSDLWRQLRAKNVGGSEVAALFGCSSYLTRYALWMYKSGKLDAPDLSADERIQSGIHMEPGAIAWANRRWKTEFRQKKVYVEHPSVVGMGCTPDGFDYTQGRPILCQAKMVDGRIFKAKWVAQGDNITHAPLEIMLQVHHEMECVRAEESWLIVVVNGNQLYRMICRYDEEVGSMLRKSVMEFWLSIEHGLQPEPDFNRDGDTISAFIKTLPLVAEQDITTDHALEVVAEHNAKRNVMLAAQDAYKTIHAELENLVGNAHITKCGEYILKRNKIGSLSVQSTQSVF